VIWSQIIGRLPSSQIVPLGIALLCESNDIFLVSIDIILGFLDRSAATTLFRPSADVRILLLYGSFLCVDLGADLALFVELIGVHGQAHAASFAGSVLFRAMLSEVTPLPAIAGEAVDIVKAHIDRICEATVVSTVLNWRSHLKQDCDWPGTYWLSMDDSLEDSWLCKARAGWVGVIDVWEDDVKVMFEWI
jgi:hypothetical protein